MSSDVKFGGGVGGGGGRHDVQLVKDFLQSTEPTVLQGGCREVLSSAAEELGGREGGSKGRKCVLSRFDLLPAKKGCCKQNQMHANPIQLELFPFSQYVPSPAHLVFKAQREVNKMKTCQNMYWN